MMIRLLNNKDKDMALEYLQRNYFETTFLAGNVETVGLENNKETRRCADYYGYFEGDALKGILAFYNLGSCIPHFEASEAIPEFAELMKQREFSIMLGMEKVTKPLHEAVGEAKVLAEYSESSYFVNRDNKPFAIYGITFVDADKAEEELAVKSIIHARKDGFHEEKSREEVLQTLKTRSGDEGYLLALDGDRVVALASIQAATPSINQIGSVYTWSEERGKGYCKAVVSELCRRIQERNKLPALFVKKNNVPAVKAYTALGFEHYDDYLMVSYQRKE
jgi:uncharacterized protein